MDVFPDFDGLAGIDDLREVVGALLMFALAWIFLPDLPEYRTGLIIVGLARCIAMVIIWNDLACGDREAAAVLVALNSIFQVIAFAGLGWFYLSVLPGWLGLEQSTLDVSFGQIAVSVLIFLGVPLLAGYLSRRIGERRWGRQAYEGTFLPGVHPDDRERADRAVQAARERAYEGLSRIHLEGSQHRTDIALGR